MAFSYLSPLIYPLTGTPDSKLKVALDLSRICANRLIPGYTGALKIEWAKYVNGQKRLKKTSEFTVLDGAVGGDFFHISTDNDEIGYIEIHITSSSPVFTAIDVSAGYAFFNCRVNGVVNVNADAKYARPLIIDQIRHTGSFCLTHSNCYMDKNNGISTSFIVVNPYKKALKAKIRNQTGNQIELIVKAQFTEVVDLSQILQDQTASTCMVVSKNRHPAWILHKNSLSILENSINRIDHLELFRAEESYQDFSLRQFLKRVVHRLNPLKL